MDFFEAFREMFDLGSVYTGAIRILLIIIATLVAMWVIGGLLRRFEKQLAERGVAEGDKPSESRKRAQTLFGLSRHAVSVAVWIVSIMMVLKELGLEIGPMLAGAGIVGVAVGFGAQSLVKDYFAGFFLILENQVRVGDAARINGTFGIVEEIQFRTIVLRDLTGEVHIFPHGTVSTLSNLSNEWSAYMFNIGVAYKENTDRVVELIREVAGDLRQDEYFGRLILEDVEVFGVDQFADSAVVIKGRLKTKPIRQWEVGREFLRRVKLAFDANGVEIPFPHTTLYFGEASKPIAIQHEASVD